jgi:sulfide:quinone oxidoreductase
VRPLSVTHTEAPLHQGGFGAPARLRVVVAGGGIGGLETLVALRGLVGPRVGLTLVAPEQRFTVPALDAYEPFGLGAPQHHPLVDLAADLEAALLCDAVTGVDRGERVVRLASGARLAYDVLVLAVGASPSPAFAHGLCLERAHEAEAFDEVLADLRAEERRAVAIVVPPGAAWTLPAYELALMVVALGDARQVTLVTAEHAPLEAFGSPATALARAELAACGVRLRAGVHATIPRPNVVELEPGARLHTDGIVHLAALGGPNILGVARDSAGFILVDDGFRTRGDGNLFAIGDATASARKQGGLAAQQADLVAEQIAQRVGAEHAPRPYRPVLRGLLRTAHGPRYLRAGPPGATPPAEVSEQCLWWPPGPIAARWLVPWLAARGREGSPLPSARLLPLGAISRAVSR